MADTNLPDYLPSRRPFTITLWREGKSVNKYIAVGTTLPWVWINRIKTPREGGSRILWNGGEGAVYGSRCGVRVVHTEHFENLHCEIRHLSSSPLLIMWSAEPLQNCSPGLPLNLASTPCQQNSLTSIDSPLCILCKKEIESPPTSAGELYQNRRVLECPYLLAYETIYKLSI